MTLEMRLKMPVVKNVDLATVVPYVAELLDQLQKEITRREHVADHYGDTARRDLHRQAEWHLKNCIEEYALMMGMYEG